MQESSPVEFFYILILYYSSMDRSIFSFTVKVHQPTTNPQPVQSGLHAAPGQCQPALGWRHACHIPRKSRQPLKAVSSGETVISPPPKGHSPKRLHLRRLSRSWLRFCSSGTHSQSDRVFVMQRVCPNSTPGLGIVHAFHTFPFLPTQ